MLCRLSDLSTPPLFLMLFRKGQNELKAFIPHGRGKLPERANLLRSPGGCLHLAVLTGDTFPYSRI